MESKKQRDGFLRERTFVEGETDLSLSPIESGTQEKKCGETGEKLKETVLWLRILDRTRIVASHGKICNQGRFSALQEQHLRTLGRVVKSVSGMSINP